MSLCPLKFHYLLAQLYIFKGLSKIIGIFEILASPCNRYLDVQSCNFYRVTPILFSGADWRYKLVDNFAGGV